LRQGDQISAERQPYHYMGSVTNISIDGRRNSPGEYRAHADVVQRSGE
jgi:hypothetical protein